MIKTRNLFPEGNGIMEVRGLNAELIDVAVYTQQALEDAPPKWPQCLRNRMCNTDLQKAKILKRKDQHTKFWDDAAGSYRDSYGTREQALSVAKGALEQLHMGLSDENNSVHLLENQKFYEANANKFLPFLQEPRKVGVTNKNWVISTRLKRA